MFSESRSLLLAAVAAGGLTLTACGGSSTGSAPNSHAGGSQNNSFAGVSGPLDAVQNPVSDQVLGQLAGAVAGTPLEGVIDCVDQAVVHDLLDVVDRILVALQEAAASGDPQTALTAAAGDIQAATSAFAEDLSGVLTSLAGEGCSGSGSGGDGGVGDNPLAGTPLAPLGDALAPVLATFPASGGSSSGDLQLTTLSDLVSELNQAFQQGFAMVPDEAATAPVVGGLLNMLGHALHNLDGTLQAAAIYDANATSIAVSQTVDALLTDVLTEVVPIKFIEEQAGQGPVISSQIEDGIDQVTAALPQALNPALDVALEQLLNGALTPLMNPLENTLLPAILAPITDAIAEGLPSAAGGPTGTPLDAVLASITAALGGGLPTGGSGLTGTPLDILLDPLADAIGATGGVSCPVTDTPLDALCGLVDGLLDGANLDSLLNQLGVDALPL